MTSDSEQAEPNISRFEEAFLGELGGCLNRDDFTEYSARQHKGGASITGRSRVYAGDKLDRVVITRYLLKGGQRGVVIFGYPRAEYEIPAFVFYVGGRPPAKTLTILDLVPPSSRTDMSAFRQLSERSRASMGLAETGVDFLRSIASPYLLHCAFQPLDPGDLLTTMRQSARIWRSGYIEPAERDDKTSHVRQRTGAILKLKETLHRNSPAIGVFTRSFGREMSDVFARAEYGGEPGVSIGQPVETASPETWQNRNLGVVWTADARELVLEAPLFIRRMIRRRIEQEAAAQKLSTVTADLVEQCERKYRKG